MSEKVAKMHLEEKLRDHSLKRTKYRLDCLVCNIFEKDGKTHSLCENREKEDVRKMNLKIQGKNQLSMYFSSFLLLINQQNYVALDLTLNNHNSKCYTKALTLNSPYC